MRILFFGDVVGRPGREALRDTLPGLIREHRIDFVIANGENATHGKGLIAKHYDFLLKAGVDCVTLGNHYANKGEIFSYIDQAGALVRPLNVIARIGGSGSILFEKGKYKIRVTNVLGTAFMKEEVGDPYLALRELIEAHAGEDAIHVVDFHGEATGEKIALALAFDGKVSAFLGTHTHVQTADARILPNGTAFMSDVGMCGAANGVLGFEARSVMRRVLFGSKSVFTIDEADERMVNAVILDVDEKSRRCRKITPVSLKVPRP